ncbi:hypothetical protein [Alkalibaculum sporogenes]|uniref:hypothetical protein n=1 Tax=Alkalibaculum sporogenes TaxID=2655001 RepID=UPI00187B3F1B|nr:hypothetical protein [Alkalibaculum sporogenes]
MAINLIKVLSAICHIGILKPITSKNTVIFSIQIIIIMNVAKAMSFFEFYLYINTELV